MSSGSSESSEGVLVSEARTGPLETRVDIYDTTLRDGTQGEGISLSADDKLRILRRLDALGVAFVEAGWPGSNPKDAELFARVRDEEWRTTIVAFGSTRRVGARAEEDLCEGRCPWIAFSSCGS